jgi:exodeoxyribonuclease VII small subunit
MPALHYSKTNMAELETSEADFEQSIARLEEIVRDLEDGQLTLEAALAKYEAGVGLLRNCYEKLTIAEARISLLAGLDAEGNPILEPFEHSASAGVEGSERKRRRG